MKLLIISPSIHRGGVEEYILRLASAGVKEGWHVDTAFPKTKGTASLVADLVANDAHYHVLPLSEKRFGKVSRLRKDFRNFANTVLLLMRIRPDVVQLALPYTPYCFGSIIACGLLRVPTLVRFGLVPREHSFKPSEIRAYNWARARNQKWMALSNNNRELVCRSFHIARRDQVIVIYNGASPVPESQIETEAVRRQVREELGCRSNTRLILTVGRLDRQKGYIDLMDVIPHIVKEFSDVSFVWVGDGEQGSELSGYVHDYGIEDNVLLTGYRSDVPRFLSAADLFVFPTHFEGGQSSAIAEAMAYGLPIVSSDASGIPEVIEHDVHGVLFKAGERRELLERLRWALRHPDEMQRMAESAKLHAAQNFSLEKMLNETVKVLASLAESR